jgi:glycosyltransferase involved in cell wall biosynthesis
MTADELWKDVLAGTDILKSRPDFRFDPVFCSSYYPDFFASKPKLIRLLERSFMMGKRGGNAYQMLKDKIPNINRVLSELVIDPRLRRAIDDEIEDAFELVFELIAVGEPIDRKISNFSQDHYYYSYPDIKKAGIAALRHYIQFGMNEGRHSLRDVRENQYAGDIPFDPDKETCMICTHDLSKTGAPIVALELARRAAKTHNVVVMSLRNGELLSAFQETSLGVFVSLNLDEDMSYVSMLDIGDIDFAVLNSVETSVIAKALVRRDIPFATYLHEFSEYTQPAHKMIFLSLFSDLLVFSSELVRDSWRNIFENINFDVDKHSMILPQAELQIGQVSRAEYVQSCENLSALLGVDCTNRRIIYGAGYAHWRKGTDMFVLTAQIARQRDPEALFIWIGDGANHEDENFGVWLDKHLREAGANSPDGNLFFLPAGEYYLDICKAADAFYLCSRLDPLPNVIFDAAKYGSHVVLFENASGFHDATYTQHASIETVGYSDISGACDLLLSAPRKSAETLEREPVASETADKNIFGEIADRLKHVLSQDRFTIATDGEYDVPVMFLPDEKDDEARIKERRKIWSYGRTFVWQSMEDAQAALTHSDDWVHKTCRIERFAQSGSASVPDFNVHMHAFYVDNLAHDFNQHKALHLARRIVITTDNDEKSGRIADLAAHAGLTVETKIVRNKGRDILPFLNLLADERVSDDDIWCHVHQKKSVGTSLSGEIWHKFLLTILLGDKSGLSSAMEHIQQGDVGLVAPFDPYQVNWSGSRRLLDQINTRLPEHLPHHLLIFPVGNMFWTKGSVVAQMNGLFDENYPWPNEPLPSDGTEFHLIERLWPAAAAMAGLGSVFLEKADQQRT